MKKILITTVLVLMVSIPAAMGQFFPTKEGTSLRYASYDKSGKKADAYMVYAVDKVSGTADDMTVHFTISMDDGKGTTLLEGMEAKVDIIDGETYMDPSSLFPTSSLTGGVVTFAGDGTIFPAKLSVGQKIDDSSASMTLNLGIVRIKTVANTANQTVVAKETLDTEAGKIECYKITADQLVTVGKKSGTYSYTLWVAPKIGTVRQESFDEKGKLSGRTELVAIE